MNFDTFKPPIAVISLTDICLLNCSFCNNSKKYSKNNIMELEKFKIIIEKFIEQGIFSFEITPTVGDSIIIENLYEYFDFLENHPKVEKYFWFTSLVSKKQLSKEKFEKIFNNRTKFYTVVSVYSLISTNFFKKTNSTLKKFNIFKSNLDLLLKHVNTTVIVRDRTDFSILESICFKKIVNECKNSNIIFGTNAVDIDRNIIPISERKNICCNFMINFGCFMNGDISMCMYADFYKKNIIGNIFTDDLKEILDNYYYKNINSELCKNCYLYDGIDTDKSDFKSVYNESFKFDSFLGEYKNFRIGGISEIN
jgi:MoaA/NifB/PqqE/SkfB family radical SAM enzyme